MSKLLTDTFLKKENILPGEQVDYQRNSRGTKDHLLLDEAVLRDHKKRTTNPAMAWRDYQKVYDMISHS